MTSPFQNRDDTAPAVPSHDEDKMISDDDLAVAFQKYGKGLCRAAADIVSGPGYTHHLTEYGQRSRREFMVEVARLAAASSAAAEAVTAEASEW